jgi:hypothetical protein
MVAFGTLREKELLPTVIRARFMAVKSFGVFEIDQDYLPANDAISINEVSDKIDSFENYQLRKREQQFSHQGKERPQGPEKQYPCRSGLEECVAIEMQSSQDKGEAIH